MHWQRCPLGYIILCLMRKGVFCKWFFDILRLGTGKYIWLKTVQKNAVAWIYRRSTSGKVT